MVNITLWGRKAMSETVYMIENTVNKTFWTNNGFKKRHGNLYTDPAIAQRQIDKGKLAIFLSFGIDGVTLENIKISEFTLTRVENVAN